MIANKRITVCLPCRNEGRHLKEVIRRIPKSVDEIIVISNNSSDNTVQIAKKLGVKVLEDNRAINGIGYGYAHISGIEHATGDIIVGADGDATYPLEEIDTIVSYLIDNKLDFVSCNRYPIHENTHHIPIKLRFGVWILNQEVRLLYGYKIKDILSGMWVFKKSVAKKLNLKMGDWNLSPQIKLNAIQHPNINFDEYSIAQYQRLGTTHQQHFKTGVSHLLWIAKNRLYQINRNKNWFSDKYLKIFMLIILFLASITKLLLTSGQHLFIIGPAQEDDRLFINLAHNILLGHWLGSYNSLTLVKGPFYPLYIAFMHLLHMPLLTSEQILYIVSVFVFLVCIFPLLNTLKLISKSPIFKFSFMTVLGIVLIFNPISSDSEPSTRVVRNGIYPSLTLLTISLFIALLAYRHLKIWKYTLLALAGGIIMACFWLTREEGVWILPFSICSTIYISFILFKQKLGRAWKYKIAALILPYFILYGILFTVSNINYHFYGVNDTVEVKAPQFLAAYSSLTRVEAKKWLPVIPVSKASQEAIYKVSPAFLKLKPYLDGAIGKGWAEVSKSVYPQYPGEIAGGWFVWAFRFAVQAAGYYKNGRTAMNYYSTLAKQVNTACAKKELICTKSTDNLYPPLSTRYLVPFINSMERSYAFITEFQQYNPNPPNSIGTRHSLKLFSTLTNEPITNRINPTKIHILSIIGKLYQYTFPIITFVAIALFIILLFFNRPFQNLLFIITGLLGITIVIRMILLSLVNVTSFPAINTLYYACAYPLLIIFDLLIFLLSYEVFHDKLIYLFTKSNQ